MFNFLWGFLGLRRILKELLNSDFHSPYRTTSKPTAYHGSIVLQQCSLKCSRKCHYRLKDNMSFQTANAPIRTLCITKPAGGRKAVTFTVDDSAQEQKRCSSKTWIFNFCAALTASTGCCLGILRHKDHVYHVHDVEDAKPQKLSLLQDLIDRRELLLQRKRCDLALALAYAVLQLGKTPWLRSRWNLNDVHFSESGTHHRLWISKSFWPGTSTESAGEAKKQSIIKNDSLFSLGVALLELAYGKPLSSFQTDDAPDGNGNQHDLTRYLVADRLTKKLLDEDSPNFASAVSSCIDPVSETREFDLANEGFRKRYFKDVILPLQEDYDQLFKRKT